MPFHKLGCIRYRIHMEVGTLMQQLGHTCTRLMGRRQLNQTKLKRRRL